MTKVVSLFVYLGFKFSYFLVHTFSSHNPGTYYCFRSHQKKSICEKEDFYTYQYHSAGRIKQSDILLCQSMES
ncbi:hypothetical protein KC19_2G114900 [Ceratodon purpureus]|uniref:Uncharacterized protein n=1 Tax=Ceratodon purpureus TaxID=3225 RepID=A0A8T0IUW3_CERPU|nr:hypothetical protein KC19_2G114900 [Ceratodon purpureus]